MVATIFTDIDGRNFDVQGNSISEVMKEIDTYLNVCYKDSYMDDDILITLTDKAGKQIKFWWLVTIAHYCFAKGRISKNKSLRLMCNK